MLPKKQKQEYVGHRKGYQLGMDQSKGKVFQKTKSVQQLGLSSQQEFQCISSQAQSDIFLYQKRAESHIKGVPKVRVLEKSAIEITVAVQNPKVLFYEWIWSQSQAVRVSQIQTAVNCFSELSWVYGHFRITEEMMRVTKDGNVVCWINGNFSLNRRQFPFQFSRTSESLFLQNLTGIISTFLTISDSPIRIRSLGDLKAVIKRIKKALATRPISQMQHTPDQNYHQNSGYNRHKPISQQKISEVSEISDVSEKKQEWYQLEKPKKRLLTRINSCSNEIKISQETSSVAKKSLNEDFHFIIPHKQGGVCKPAKNFTLERNLSNLSNCMSKKVEKESPIYEPIPAAGKDLEERLRNRKLSADLPVVKNWIKVSGKRKDFNFPVSSFSTRVTFSSKGQNEGIHEIDDLRQKTSEEEKGKERFSTRQRTSANLQRYLRESGIKISKICEEGEMQVDFNSLFSSIDNESDGKNGDVSKLKESELKKELEFLFSSELLRLKDSQEIELEISQELSNILG